MRVLESSKLLVLICLGAGAMGCQIVGGLSSELSLGGGGAGGEGGMGGAGGSAGGLAAREPLVWEATDPGPTFVYALPGWLDFTSNNVERSSQIAPGVLRLGYLDDEPRPRNVGFGYGLAVESTRTNQLPYAHWEGATWTNQGDAPNGSMAIGAGSVVDPTGGMGARLFASKGNQQSRSTKAAGTVASAWLAGTLGVEPYAYFAYGSSAVMVASTEFRRYEVKRSLMDPVDLLRLESQSVAGYAAIQETTRIAAYAAQVEEGTYASSFIPTSGMPVTREAEIVRVKTKDFAPLGYFDLLIRYAPHYATAEQEYDHDILAIEDDGVFVRMKVGGSLVFSVAGAEGEIRIDNLTWAREQALEVHAIYLPNRRYLSISGAMTGGGEGELAGPVGPIVKDGDCRLLSDNDGAQEGSDLKYVEIQ